MMPLLEYPIQSGRAAFVYSEGRYDAEMLDVLVAYAPSRRIIGVVVCDRTSLPVEATAAALDWAVRLDRPFVLFTEQATRALESRSIAAAALSDGRVRGALCSFDDGVDRGVRVVRDLVGGYRESGLGFATPLPVGSGPVSYASVQSPTIETVSGENAFAPALQRH
jgi:hypothetical protein